MSITETDIKKLASLSRMKLTEVETAAFAKEIDSILGYVEQIKEVSAIGLETAPDLQNEQNSKVQKPKIPDHRNFLREDMSDTDINPDPKEVVDCAPSTQDGFVKVKKILG